MTENILFSIIKSCHLLDCFSHKIYEKFFIIFKDEPVGTFWKRMANEENQHIKFWKSLLPYAESMMIPQIFDDPEKVYHELSKNIEKIKEIYAHEIKNIEINKAFFISYKLEFYLLHPVFESFFSFASDLEDIIKIHSLENAYEDHIKGFIEGLKNYGKVTPEMELLGETLEVLWNENRNLVNMGNIDGLTKIRNRRSFFQTIYPLASFASRNNVFAGLMMIDIDDFKKINDTYGHQAGDKILYSVANIIKKSIRKSDICGRYGGEEFIVFLSQVEPEKILKISEDIRKKIENENPGNIDMTISIGCCVSKISNDVEKSIDHIIKIADSNLYEAKRNGKNRVVCKEK